MLSVLLSAAPEGIRFSSYRVTNISSSRKSASLIPYYPIPVPYSRIRSSKYLANFYSKLFGKTQILFEGRVEPQLNGLEGGFELFIYFLPNATLPQGVGFSPKEHSILIRSGCALP